MQKVYVLVKSEYDGSGHPEVLRVLASKDNADRDLAMLKRAMFGGRVELVEAEFDPSLLDSGEEPERCWHDKLVTEECIPCGRKHKAES